MLTSEGGLQREVSLTLSFYLLEYGRPVLSRDSPVKEDSTGSSVEAPHRRRDVIAISVGMCSTLDPTDGRTLGRELCRVVVRDCSEVSIFPRTKYLAVISE